MATSQLGKIQIELGRTLTDYTVMTDSGDNQIFTAGTIYSGKSGYAPDVRPNGIVTGQKVLSPHATSNTVTIAGFTAYSKGAMQTVAAASATFSRPGTAGLYKIVSITMASDGSIAKVDGTSSATAFSTTRDANGGPPLIPVDSVEVGQIKLTSSTAAVIVAGDILQDIGDHAEYADYPVPEVSNIGNGSYAAVSAEKNAHIKFNEALPDSHTGSVPKRTYIKYYTPSFTTLAKTADFKPAELGVSKSSETVYEGSGVSGAVGSMKADSVGDVTFAVLANDGITDAIIREKNQTVTVKWYPDANKVPYMLSQGMLGFNRDFPSGTQNKINVTVYCEGQSVEFAS